MLQNFDVTKFCQSFDVTKFCEHVFEFHHELSCFPKNLLNDEITHGGFK